MKGRELYKTYKSTTTTQTGYLLRHMPHQGENRKTGDRKVPHF